MSEWKKVKLKELIKEVNERNKDEKVKTVLSVTNSRGFVSQEEYFEGTVHSANISNYKIVRKNQFAYNPSRVNVGSIDILKDYEYGVLSPMYVVFEVDITKLLPDYFKYYFQTNRFFENVKNNTQGSVRNSLSFRALADFDYLLPPIAEQEKIVKILRDADSIIEKYGLLLEEKKQFIKSQFIEMFGNPINNSKKIKTEEMTNICEIIDGYRGSNYPKSGEFYEKEYCLFLNAKNVTNNGFSFANCMFITEKEDKLLGKGKLQRGDIVLTTRGTVGNIAFYTDDVPFDNMRINSGMVILRMNKEKINEVFFIEQFKLQLDKIKNKVASGSAQPQLPISKMKNIKILIPPIEDQNKYANFIKQIDKQKSLLEQQKKNYENLKKGLMQKLLTGKVKVNV